MKITVGKHDFDLGDESELVDVESGNVFQEMSVKRKAKVNVKQYAKDADYYRAIVSYIVGGGELVFVLEDGTEKRLALKEVKDE